MHALRRGHVEEINRVLAFITHTWPRITHDRGWQNTGIHSSSPGEEMLLIRGCCLSIGALAWTQIHCLTSTCKLNNMSSTSAAFGRVLKSELFPENFPEGLHVRTPLGKCPESVWVSARGNRAGVGTFLTHDRRETRHISPMRTRRHARRRRWKARIESFWCVDVP